MSLLENRAALGKRAARVLPFVPRLGANGRKEVVHRCLVATKESAIEVARIPIDQHSTKVEDGSGGEIAAHPLTRLLGGPRRRAFLPLFQAGLDELGGGLGIEAFYGYH